MYRLAYAVPVACLLAAGAWADPCTACTAPNAGDAGWPGLEAAGYARATHSLLTSWQERAGQSVVHGYRLLPADGPPFDVYLTPDGAALSPQARERLGIRDKQWHLPPTDIAPLAAPAVKQHRPVAPGPRATPGRAVRIPVPPVDRDALVAEDRARGLRPTRIGVVQAVDPPVRIDAGMPREGSWETGVEGSRVWSATFEAPGAAGLRVAFEPLQLPPGAYALVYDADTRVPAGAALRGGAGTTWAATCFTDRVTVEVVVPAGTRLDTVSLAIARVVHVYADLDALPWSKQLGTDIGCWLDVSCFPTWAIDASRAVGGIGAVTEEGFLWCTGTLLNDTDSSSTIPYFLTAYHCLEPTGTRDTVLEEAASIEVYWLYQTGSCNGEVPGVRSVPRTTGGAQFLVGASEARGADFALLRLNAPPPEGLVYAGWTSDDVVPGAPVTAIQHPRGSHKRISFGTLVGVNDRAFPGSDFYEVRWNEGVTAPGSSGAPLMRADQRVIGQLWGGDSFCETPTALDYFGRLDRAFPIIQPYLAPGADGPPDPQPPGPDPVGCAGAIDGGASSRADAALFLLAPAALLAFPRRR